MFKKILIANRGEIACRIIETCRKMGVVTVAVYSDADARARHVRMADEAVHIGASPSSKSYLRGEVILKAAKDSGAEAIHPGYGFLSENAAFSDACAKAGITFIGPSADSIRAMGLKDRAKDIMEAAGVPIVPGYKGEDQDLKTLAAEAKKIGYPVLIKAVAGGGGKGMRLVEDAKDFADLLANCQREGLASFGNAHVLLEKYITKPRHIEVQVFGDNHGHVVHLFERDCSLQRRHQKVVEEAPAPNISDKMRKSIGDAAVKAAKAINYSGAGTIEFIVDVSNGDANAPFYFMEMNTRLQVEHPVTEMITEQDLVEWQLRVASGEKLPLAQKDIAINGHAFEVRLYAEDPAQNFMPQTGRVTHFSNDALNDQMRVDTGIEAGDSVTAFYDPMIAKLITHGQTRDEAAKAMRSMLEGLNICGLNTNQEFLHNIFVHPDFLDAQLDTGFIPRHEDALIPDHYGRPSEGDLKILHTYLMQGADEGQNDIWGAHDNWRMCGDVYRKFTLNCRGETYNLHTNSDKNFVPEYASIIKHDRTITLFNNGRVIRAELPDYNSDGAGDTSGRITASMPGRIVSVMAKKGDVVEKDQPLLIMESMKVEITIRAGCGGTIEDLPIAVNDQVSDGALLVQITAEDAA